MTRKPIPGVRTHVWIDADLFEDMKALLHSPIEGRIPHGEQGRFVNEALRFRLRGGALDLAPFTGDPPGTWIIRGDAGAIERLRELLSAGAVQPLSTPTTDTP